MSTGPIENRLQQRHRRQRRSRRRRFLPNPRSSVLQVTDQPTPYRFYLHAGRSRFLTSSQSFDIGRWSSDGLAYLTLDGDVKEELADNLPALKALFSLCQSQDAHVLYSLTTILVNLTNTYDVQKPEKELAELAAYAKQHIPKEHPKVCRAGWVIILSETCSFQDEKAFYDERRRKLVEAGVIPVLVQLCKHKSENCREQIAR